MDQILQIVLNISVSVVLLIGIYIYMISKAAVVHLSMFD